MESVLSTNDKQNMISSFLEIAVGQTADTARQFLQATSWKLEEAIQLFYIGNELGSTAQALSSSSTDGSNSVQADEPVGREPMADGGNGTSGKNDADEVRPPLPVKREVLYDDTILYPGASGMGYPSRGPASVVAFRNFDEEMKRAGVWESEQGATSTAENPRDNLASLYRPPFHLMFRGSFEKAKAAAAMQDKWLVVNLQSTREFSSHMLNRDTWANEAVSQTISTNFIFWQVYDDTSEGQKVCTYYKLDSIPVVLIIDPVTGQKMRSWFGMIQPVSLLEDLLPFMDGGPKDHHVTLSHKRPRERSLTPPQKLKDESKEEDAELEAALAASLGDVKDPVVPPSEGTGNTNKEEDESSSSKKMPEFPPLPEEEPKGDKSLLCRVGVRLPDGRRVQRNFLRSDPIQLLWSFCSYQLQDSEEKNKLFIFRLTQAIPGASNILDYDSKLTFEESGLANSMISVTWK